MSDPVKKTIALVAAAAILFVAYYANYLPLRKSQAYIATLRMMGNIRSIDEFKSVFARVLDLPSPIGQEELVRNVVSTVVGIVGNGSSNPAIVEPLVQFAEDQFRPIMQSGKGMSFSQNLYILANLHQSAFMRTRNPQHLLAAKAYYEEGLKRAPQRPQFLYGLLDVYRILGDGDGVRRTTDNILTLWPNDERVRAAADQFFEALNAQRSSTVPAE